MRATKRKNPARSFFYYSIYYSIDLSISAIVSLKPFTTTQLSFEFSFVQVQSRASSGLDVIVWHFSSIVAAQGSAFYESNWYAEILRLIYALLVYTLGSSEWLKKMYHVKWQAIGTVIDDFSSQNYGKCIPFIKTALFSLKEMEQWEHYVGKRGIQSTKLLFWIIWLIWNDSGAIQDIDDFEFLNLVSGLGCFSSLFGLKTEFLSYFLCTLWVSPHQSVRWLIELRTFMNVTVFSALKWLRNKTVWMAETVMYTLIEYSLIFINALFSTRHCVC